jgi:acetoin utilization protein AcuB
MGPLSQLDSSVWLLAAGLFSIAAAALFVLSRRGGESTAKRSPVAADAVKTRGSGVFQKRQEILSTLSSDMSSLLMRSRLEVQHLMSSRVKRVSLDAPRAEIEALMGAAQVRHLMVCRDQGQLAGVISDRDFQLRRGPTAADIMTRNPLTIAPHTPVGQVITMMVDRKISCLPVVDEGGLQGVLTTTDLLLALQCSLRLFEQFSDRMAGERKPDDSETGALACAGIQAGE